MDRYKRKFIKNAVVLPLIVAVVATALFFAALRIFDSEFPFTQNISIFAEYEKSDVMTAESSAFDDQSINKNDLPVFSANTILGSAQANGNTIEIIFNANEVNAVGRLNVSADSKWIGETGTVFCSCYKADAKFVRSLAIGDTIDIDIAYGGYKYQVVKISTADSLRLAEKQGDGIGRALILCTDADKNEGISNSYLTVVCEMTGGKPIEE